MNHILSVYLMSKPGLVVRIAMVLERRGYSIISLNLEPAEKDGLSQMTLTVKGDEVKLEQVTKQLAKLIDVLQVKVCSPNYSIKAVSV